MKQLVSFILQTISLVVLIVSEVEICSGEEPLEFTDLQYNTYSTDNGLSQSSVLCITQDKYGFIWMGTKDGLNRFDGYNFVSFKHSAKDSNTISNNDVIALQTDKKGNLLIGTRGGGFNKFIYSSNRFIRYPLISEGEFIVNAVFENKDSTIWLATSEGLIKGTPINDIQYQFENISYKSIYKSESGAILPRNKSVYSTTAINQLSNDFYLIGTDKGAFLLNKNNLIFSRIDLEKINTDKVNSILVLDTSTFWIGSAEGIARVSDFQNEQMKVSFYNETEVKKRQIKVNWINSIISDKLGNIWAASRGGGLLKFDQKGNYVNYMRGDGQTGSLTDNMINSLFVDNKGVLWIGTESKGCSTLDLFRKKFYYLSGSPSGNSFTNNLITAITGNDQKSIWIGTAFNGIGKIIFHEDFTYTLKQYEELPLGSNRVIREVISLLLDKNNNLWIGSASNTIIKYNESYGFKSIDTRGFVFAIHQDQNGMIWLGTWGNGIIKLDPDTEQLSDLSDATEEYRSLGSDIVLSFFDDNQSNLWIGTKGGGVSVTPLEVISNGFSDFVNYRHDEKDTASLSHNDIYCIMQDSKDRLWIGTGEGLNRVIFPDNKYSFESIQQKNLQFRSYYEEDGLPNNVIYGIIEDNNGNLWLSTNKGLSVFDPEKLEFRNYSINDGIQAEEFHSNAYYNMNDNVLFLGGIRGITFFDPEYIKPNPFKSEVVITDLTVLNKKVTPGQKIKGKVILEKDIAETKKIVFNHKHKEITFEFSAMHYSNLNNVQYQYRLIGFNDEWHTITNNERRATYTNLFEGKYTFQIKATNNDGIWTNKPAELELVILPPFWRNPWFYPVYVALIAGMLLILRKYTIIAVTEKNRLHIESLEQSKLIEMTEAKMRFFTNISHEIRTPLVLIHSPLEEVLKKGTIDDESKNSLKLVLKNVKRLVNLTNQLLQLRKIDRGVLQPKFAKIDPVPFISDILEYFEQQANPKNIKLKFSHQFTFNEFYADKEMITTVIYNLLSNAYKYTPTGGKIKIKLSTHQGALSKVSYLNLVKRKKTRHIKWMVIKISDTGIGIPEKELKHIFHRFYQIDNKEKYENTGSGIGLSLVKEYIDLHKGSIEVESQKERGTKFTVYLPLGKSHIPKEQITNSETDNDSPKNLLISKFNLQEDVEPSLPKNLSSTEHDKSILIIDDNKDMLTYLATNLSDQYNLMLANSAKEGMKQALRNQPHLIISDIMMPDIDGLEFCSQLKSNIETSHIPVILLTAKATEDNIIEGYETGADLYITKPFSMQLLDAQIKHLLETRKKLIEKFSKQVFLQPREISITPTDEKFLTRLIDLIEANITDTNFDVSKLVAEMNLSHSTLLRKVKILTGDPLVEFIKRYRLKKAAMMLEKEKLPVNEVAYAVGFSDPKYFSKCFNKEFDVLPSKYKET